MGTTITPPGVGVRFGSDTTTPATEGNISVASGCFADNSKTEELERAESIPLGRLVISKAEAMNLNPKPPAAKAVTLNSKARTITVNVMFRILFAEKDLFPSGI